MSRLMFSLIVPTRHRTEPLRRLLDSIKATTRDLSQLEVILVMDEDDEESVQFRFDGLTLKRVTVPRGLTMGALNLEGYRAATGQRLMLLNDDVVVQTPGWDEQALAAFRSFPDQMVLVHVNDLLFRDTLCTFPFLTREFCSLLDGICPPGYIRYRIDDHIHNIFDLLSLLGHHRRIFLPDVIFAHMNVGKPEEQGSARYVPDPATHEIDSRLFEALLPQRKRIAIQAMHQIEGRLSSGQHSAWQRKLEPVTESVAIRLREHARWFSSLAVGPEHLPRVTIGIVSADLQSANARKCVELVRTHTTNYELILLDNTQGPASHHSHEMNRILSVCQTDYLVLMDDDVLVGPGWLEGMLRCVGPDVGVVTPLHKDRDGRLSYAGVVLRPDDTGHHSYILEAPAGSSPIQTLCTAIMLIDIPKCGHLRLDEGYAKDFGDIDYGLRVWEAGFQVVCSPYSRVTRLSGATSEQDRQLPQLFERLQALRGGVWKTIPEFAAIENQAAEIDKLVEEAGQDQREFLEKAANLVRSLAAYPALQDYLAVRARAGIGERLPFGGDPATGRLAILLGMAGHPILFEASFEGMDIVLQNLTYYALPQDEGPFSYERMAGHGYSRSFEAPSLEGVKALILQHKRAPAGRHIVAGADAAGAGAAAAGPRSAPPATGNRRSETERLAGLVEARNRIIARLSGALAGRGRRATVQSYSASRSNPLAHFLETGAYAGCRPNPLFDPVYYLTENPDVAAAGLNPLAHFLERGAQEGRRPNPLFDTAYYLKQNPDVAAAGVNPLAHFLEVGAAQGCKPNPLFDTAYYLQQNPDVAADRINPLAHFLERGAKEGRRPNPLFDTAYYLDQNPDVVESGMNPLAHFLEFGAPEGRRPSPAFDTAGYLHRNPEVARAGINPLAHFLQREAEGGAFFLKPWAAAAAAPSSRSRS